MGVYWYLACTRCKTMLGVHKLSEREDKKDEAVWRFLRMHVSPYGKYHHLVIVGDDCADGEVIKDGAGGWTTDYDVEYPIDFKAENGRVR